MEKNITFENFYSKLEDKTQMVKNINFDENGVRFTNRLQHTKEVCIFAKKIVCANSLEKNVNLDRLIFSASAHDVGHTPFGHAGEETLNDLFLSRDNSHFSETYPGVFRHNINSFKVLVDNGYFNGNSEKSAIIIDSIIKHSSIFPKNYIYSVFKEENVIKLDYLFKRANFRQTAFFKEFTKQIKSKDCKYRSVGVLKGRKETRSCSKANLCFLKSPSYPMSAYLMYRYPITVEGTVLRWADEIACLLSDLKDFFRIIYIKMKKGENIKNTISLTRIYSKLYWIKSIYSANTLINDLIDCITLISNDINEPNFDRIYGKIDAIGEKLIRSFDIDSILRENGPDAVIAESPCKMLFGLNKETQFIFDNIKKSIYEDLHSFREVKLWNEFGRACILALTDFYKSNLKVFFKSINTNKLKKSQSLTSICNGIFSMLHLSDYKRTQEPFSEKIKDEILKDDSINFGFTNFLKLDTIELEISKYCETKNVPKTYIEESITNLLKREICYRIANLSDKEVIEEIEKYDLLDQIVQKVPKTIAYVKPIL